MKIFSILVLIVNAAFIFSIAFPKSIVFGVTGVLSLYAAYSVWKNTDIRNGICILVGMLAVARPVYVIYKEISVGRITVGDAESFSVLASAAIWVLVWIPVFLYIYRTSNQSDEI